jgi:chromosome partitioning protein
VSLAESPFNDKSVFEHAPRSRGALDYQALFDELKNSGFLQ